MPTVYLGYIFAMAFYIINKIQVNEHGYTNKLKLSLLYMIGLSVVANAFLVTTELWLVGIAGYDIIYYIFISYTEEFVEWRKILVYILICAASLGVSWLIFNGAERIIIFSFYNIFHYLFFKISRVLQIKDKYSTGILAINIVYVAVVYNSVRFLNVRCDEFLIILIILGIIVFTLIEKVNEKKEELWEEQESRNFREFYSNQISLIRVMEDSAKSIRHDLKNHMNVLYRMIEQNEKDKSLDYIHTINDKLNISANVYNTGNIELDAILNGKQMEICSLGFEFVCKVVIPENLISETYVEAYDLVVIIGNLLDNAINAEKQIESSKHVIEMYITYNMNLLKITTINGCQNKKDTKLRYIEDNQSIYDVNILNQDKNHGYGIKNIVKTSKKYFGVVSYEINHQKWIMNVILVVGR